MVTVLRLTLHHLLDPGDQDDHARSFYAALQRHLSEREDDAPFVLLQDLDRVEQEPDDDDDQNHETDADSLIACNLLMISLL